MTNEQINLSKKYIAYKFLTNLWFLGAVWLYFYRIFITDQQVGLLDGMTFAIGLIAEVPSGALADKFGRDRIVRAGQLITATGIIIQALGSSFLPFFVGQSILMIGVSLVSGADEALFFDRLKFDRQSPRWRKLVTKGSQATLVGTLIAIVVGGWLHTINPRIPWLLTGLAFISSALLVWTINDDREKAPRGNFKSELKDYTKSIQTGFGEFRKPKLWIYVPLIITVQGLFYATSYGILRLILLDRFGFTPFFGSVVIGLSSLFTIGLLSAMHKHSERLSEKKVLVYISLSAAAAIILSLAGIGQWGFLVIFVLYAGDHLLQPFMSETINYHTTSDLRATVLSVSSFLRTLPYVLLAPVLGYLSANGRLHYFLLIWPIIMIVAVIYYLRRKKVDAKIKLEII